MLSAPLAQSTLAEMTAAMAGPAPELEHLTASRFTLSPQSLSFRKPFSAGIQYAAAATSRPQRGLSSDAASIIAVCDLSRLSHPRTRPNSAYFPPNSLVAHIRTMPHLLTLSISFLPHFPAQILGQSVFFHQVTSPVWACPRSPNSYHGISAYIEALLAQIQTLRIHNVDITLFNQLTLRIPRIRTFIHDLETFQPTHARIDFAEISGHTIVSTTTLK
jgi:hypothetical protein